MIVCCSWAQRMIALNKEFVWVICTYRTEEWRFLCGKKFCLQTSRFGISLCMTELCERHRVLQRNLLVSLQSNSSQQEWIQHFWWEKIFSETKERAVTQTLISAWLFKKRTWLRALLSSGVIHNWHSLHITAPCTTLNIMTVDKGCRLD